MAKDKVALVFEVCDLGMDHSDYFPGFGASCTEYTEAVTGCGDNPKEAMEDALEMAAQGGWNVDLIHNDMGESPSVSEEDEEERESERESRLEAWREENPDKEDDEFEDDGDDDDGENNRYYYVGIRLREYDPEKDEPIMEKVAEAVERLADLGILIHNEVVSLHRKEGQELETAEVKLLLYRAERDGLESFLKEQEMPVSVDDHLIR